jgi:hypothetical protein
MTISPVTEIIIYRKVRPRLVQNSQSLAILKKFVTPANVGAGLRTFQSQKERTMRATVIYAAKAVKMNMAGAKKQPMYRFSNHAAILCMLFPIVLP